MVSSDREQRVSVRVFGSLRAFLKGQGLPDEFETDVPFEGTTAGRLAVDLGILPERVEAVFRNGKVVNIHDPVFPGDRLAFCPYGTPGPYRVFLGMARENRERARREKDVLTGEEER
jgi:hypothetical protein